MKKDEKNNKNNEIASNLNSQVLNEETRDEVVKCVQLLRDNGLTVGFSESCTGGLLSSFFTEQAGVSDVFIGSVVSYANSVKENILSVERLKLEEKGAVSFEVAQQMAEGLLSVMKTDLSVSITGIAGPTGGTATKPVGTVFMGLAGVKCETKLFQHHFQGDRKQVQLQACLQAVKHLKNFIKTK